MFVRPSCLLVLQCLHHLLVVRTGKYFPTSRSRTSSGTPLTAGLFFVRKCDVHFVFISRPTVSCLTRTSRNNSWSRWPTLLQFYIIKLFTIASQLHKFLVSHSLCEMNLLHEIQDQKSRNAHSQPRHKYWETSDVTNKQYHVAWKVFRTTKGNSHVNAS